MTKYRERLKIPIDKGDNLTIFTTYSGLQIATGYNRIVIGNRGPFIEFKDFHVKFNHFYIPNNKRWKLTNQNVYYIEYRSICRSFVKLYRQMKQVNYADYKINLNYISPFDLKADNKKIIEKLK